MKEYKLVFRMLLYIIKTDKSFESIFFAIRKAPYILIRILKYLFKPEKFIYSNKHYTSMNIKGSQHLNKLLKRKDNVIIITSYCEKPLKCPSNRFSYICKQLNIDVCSHCRIGKLKKMTEKYGVLFNVLTTLSDFTKIHIRTVGLYGYNARFIYIISFCPFAIMITKFFIYILNIKLVNIWLEKNICNNFNTFFKAEKGVKKNVTKYSDEKYQMFQNLITQVAYINTDKSVQIS
jgi:hypothetical protein